MKTLILILSLLFSLAAQAQKVAGSDIADLRNQSSLSYSTNRQWKHSEYGTTYFRLTGGNNFPGGTGWRRPAANVLRPAYGVTNAVTVYEGTYQVASLTGDQMNYQISDASEDHTGAYDGVGYLCVPTLNIQFVGNSITYGAGASDTYNTSFPAVVRTMGWDLDQVFISAYGVQAITDDALMNGTAGPGVYSTNAPFFGLRAGLTNVMVYFECINQMSPSLGNSSPLYCATNLINHSQRMRAQGHKFVAVCPTPYGAYGYEKTVELRDRLTTAQETNAFDALVQVPTVMTNNGDTRYYVDGIHFTDLGHATFATNVYAGILAAMGASAPGAPTVYRPSVNSRTVRVGR